MRRLHFDTAFDGGVWSGVSHATAGDSWLGPQGTLGMLEGLLGLSSRPIGAGVRVGQALRGLIEAPAGFWKASLQVDGLSTARELLHWADWLRLHGWAGQGGQRLEQLWHALAEVDASPAERLGRVLERLSRFDDVRFALELVDGLEALPPLWQSTLRAASSGAPRIHTIAQPADVADGLRVAQTKDFTPDPKERALQLIRPHGPLVAADVVAAALAASQSTPTLIIGSDTVLDAALRRYGVATTGAPQTPHDNVIGELLPLIIELGLSPADPQRALEFLTVPGPIHPRVARKLVHALQKRPAVGSPSWHEKLREGLEGLEDDNARKKAKERVDRVFSGTVRDHSHYPTTVLLDRVSFLQQWLAGRIETSDTPEQQARYRAAASQAALFKNLVERTSEPALSMTQVRRFLEEAHRGMATPAAFPRQAGVFAVASPGGIVAPIERVIWWNYTRGSVSRPRLPALWREEREQLQAAGVMLPSAADLARQQARQARRPFLLATESLWLICPRHETNGDEAAPHPSWDELAARAKGGALLHRLIRNEPLLQKPVRTKRATFIDLPAPEREWKTKHRIERREKESPSSVEALVGCSLQWVLSYPASLRGGSSATLPSGDQLLGSLSHHVLLERALRANATSADELAAIAKQTFLDEGPGLAAPLFLPGGTAERGIAEQVLAASARSLFELLSNGWKVVSTEEPLSGTAFDTGFEGIPDLVLEKKGTRAVVDLKWSGGSYRRRSIENGLAFQVAAYAHLLQQNGASKTAVAYFILTTQSLLTASTELTSSAGAIDAERTPAETWKLFDKAWREAWKQVAKGKLVAPGVVEDRAMPDTEVDENGELSLQPPCHFCDFTGLCGRRYGRLEVEDED